MTTARKNSRQVHTNDVPGPEAFAANGQGLERLHEGVNLPVAQAWVASPEVEDMQLIR